MKTIKSFLLITVAVIVISSVVIRVNAHYSSIWQIKGYSRSGNTVVKEYQKGDSVRYEVVTVNTLAK